MKIARKNIGVAIIAGNAARELGRALESVQFADEIVVVCSQGDSLTADVARKAGARVYEREFRGFADAKNFAISNLESEWVLSLDSDEVVTPLLSKKLVEIAGGCEGESKAAAGRRTESRKADGYRIARANFFLGRFLKHGGWFPDWQLRFFRRGRGSFKPSLIHESVVVNGPVEFLEKEAFIEHYSYPSLSEYFRKFDRYTSLASLELERKRRTVTVMELALLPVFNFLKTYFLKCGFRDGARGFIASALGAYYVFVKYAKLWERHSNR